MKEKPMNRVIFLVKVTVATWLLALGTVASAHSFNVVLVVPADVSTAVRADMTSAFLVASEERDGHADEESDGHLGGLDVYVTLAGQDQRDLIVAADPDIVVLTTNTGALPDGAVALIPLPASSPKAADFLARPAANGLAPFGDRFVTRAGTTPGPEATLAYIAARQIDLAVRALGGVEDRAALTRLLQDN
jgi:hypothetical protein